LLPNKQQPEILGVNQKLSKTDVFPDEYVFCDIQKGAWRCPQITSKTPVTNKNILLEKSKQTFSGYSSKNDISKNFNYSDLVGESLGKIHFAFNKYNLTGQNINTLSDLLPKLSGKPLLLFGYTDNIGTELYNDELALNRAKSVRQFLIDRGKPASEIHIEANGICCYLVPNGTEEQRRINRRVEVYFAD